jgi:hypothetical protein
MAETSAKEYAAEITTQLHPHIKLLRDRWQEFCGMVEKNAEQLAHYQEKHIGQKDRLIKKYPRSFFPDLEEYRQAKDAGNTKKARQLEKVAEKNKAEFEQKWSKIELEMDERRKMAQKQRWATWAYAHDSTRYLKLPDMFGEFYAPRYVVNPVSWILDDWNPSGPTTEESLLCDYAILCYVHDHNISGSELRIYSPRTYKGKYFACDEFYNVKRYVWSKERLQRAFDAVKADMDKQEQQNSFLPAQPAAVQTGPKMILNGDLIYLRQLESSLALMLKKNELSSPASVRQSKYITKAIGHAQGVIDSDILADADRSIIEELIWVHIKTVRRL